jgi:hypothetical protein
MAEADRRQNRKDCFLLVFRGTLYHNFLQGQLQWGFN